MSLSRDTKANHSDSSERIPRIPIRILGVEDDTPYYIKAIIGNKYWARTGGYYYSPANFTYCFPNPNLDDLNKFKLNSGRALTLREQSLYLRSLQTISSVSNVHFTLNETQCDMTVFVSDGLNNATLGTTFRFFNSLNSQIVDRTLVVLNETMLTRDPIESLGTMIHENIHVLNGEHGFSSFFSKPVSLPQAEQNQLYSIMNYHHSKYENLKVITPTSFDIDVLQARYGKPVVTDNHVLKLKEYFFPNHLGYDTLSTLYSSANYTTISAQGCDMPALINLRNGLEQFTNIGSNFFNLHDGMQVQNVLAGSGDTTVFLNPLNNTVDIRSLKQTAHANLFTYSPSGWDTVYGFNVDRGDKIIFEKLPNEQLSKIIVSPFIHDGQLIGDHRRITVASTLITFSEQGDKMLLIDAPHEKVMSTLYNKDNPDLVRLRKIKNHNPQIRALPPISPTKQFYEYIGKPFLNSFLSSFFLELCIDLLTKILKNKNWSRNIIEGLMLAYIVISSPVWYIALLFKGLTMTMNYGISHSLHTHMINLTHNILFAFHTLLSTLGTATSLSSLVPYVVKDLVLMGLGAMMGYSIEKSLVSKLGFFSHVELPAESDKKHKNISIHYRP